MKRVVFLVGPTAIGKTEVALRLAKRINAEIISCDSMQVYREMNIISDKPSLAQRRTIPHYLIDEVSVQRRFSVADYQRKAQEAIKRIHQKGKVALVVGGAGLYMQVLLDGIFSQNKKDILTREKLYRQAKRFGNIYLYNRLMKVDPRAASKIHPNDLRRIIRALEVFDTTGAPISKLQKKRHGGILRKFDIKIIGLICDRDELYRRVNLRVQRMFRKGLVNEVKKLLNKKLSQTASCAIGVKETKDYLMGKCNLDQVKRQLKRASRHFAKRQLTWFRKEKRIDWVKILGQDSPSVIADRLAVLLSDER